MDTIELSGERCILATAGDITRRKGNEEALRASEARLKTAIDAARIGLYDWDLISGQIVWLGHHEELFGLAQREFEGTYADVEKRIHPEDVEAWNGAIQHARAEGSALAHEYRVIWPDGSVHWIAGRGRYTYNETGRPVRMCGAVMDVTERKQAEEEMRRQAARKEVLTEISQALAESRLDVQAVLDTIAWHAAEKLGDGCIVGLLNEDGQVLHPVACHHPDARAKALLRSSFLSAPLPVNGAGVVADIVRIRQGRRVAGMDLQQIRQALLPDQMPFIDQIGLHGMLLVPLLAESRVIGTLGLLRDRPGNPYTADDQVLMQELADRAALTIQNARLFEQLQAAHSRLETLSGRLLDVQESERRAIARELHDEIGQVLTAVSTTLQAIQFAHDASTLEERLAEGIQMVDDAMTRIRDLAIDLRPSLLDDFGLVAALDWYVSRLAHISGLAAVFNAEPRDMRVPASLETTLYRVTQIALTNVVRHAQAQNVTIVLQKSANELALLIRDDGVGFDAPAALERAARGATLGLLSMQERIRLAGGALEIRSTPGRGTVVRARFAVSDWQVSG